MNKMIGWFAAQRRRGRAYQPSFPLKHLSVTWLGALLALTLLSLLSALAVGITVLSGSLLLVLIAAAFSRWVKGAMPYPHHWL